MAGVAKGLRQRFVVPPFVGSSPIVRPILTEVAYPKDPVEPALHLTYGCGCACWK